MRAPDGNSGKFDFHLPTGPPNCRSRCGKALRPYEQPKKDMGPPIDQSTDSHGSGGSCFKITDDFKNTLEPAMKSSFRSSIGTSLATGLPLFVITNGRLVPKVLIHERKVAMRLELRCNCLHKHMITGRWSIQMTMHRQPLFSDSVLVELRRDPLCETMCPLW